jgi:hypothetical protein
MSDQTTDDATIQALLERLVKFRLPRTIDIRKRVDAGERLSDEDIAFLKVALEDARNGEKFVAGNAEFHALGAQIVALYDHIVSKALENEKNA